MTRRFISLLVAAGCLAAADPPRREVFGSIGYGKTFDDEGSLGGGVNWGGGLGYRLTPRFGVEGEVNVFRTARDLDGGRPEYRARGAHVMANGLFYLSRSAAAKPYFLFGAGLLHFTDEVDFSGARVDRSGNGLAVGLGFGVKAFVSPRLSLRPEFRIYAGSAGGAVESPFTDMRLSFGLGYHW